MESLAGGGGDALGDVPPPVADGFGGGASKYSDAADVLGLGEVVWLDLPRRVVMRQETNRTLRRIVTREELWNGNRELIANLVSCNPQRGHPPASGQHTSP